MTFITPNLICAARALAREENHIAALERVSPKFDQKKTSQLNAAKEDAEARAGRKWLDAFEVAENIWGDFMQLVRNECATDEAIMNNRRLCAAR